MAFIADAGEASRLSANASTSGADRLQAGVNSSFAQHGNMTAEQIAEEEAGVKYAVSELAAGSSNDLVLVPPPPFHDNHAQERHPHI